MVAAVTAMAGAVMAMAGTVTATAAVVTTVATVVATAATSMPPMAMKALLWIINDARERWQHGQMIMNSAGDPIEKGGGGM
jgi:hypothetical protein